MPTLAVNNFNIILSVLGGWVSLFGLVSYLCKENFYLSEACESPLSTFSLCQSTQKLTSFVVISLLAGVAFSPHGGNLIRPLDYAYVSPDLAAVRKKSIPKPRLPRLMITPAIVALKKVSTPSFSTSRAWSSAYSSYSLVSSYPPVISRHNGGLFPSSLVLSWWRCGSLRLYSFGLWCLIFLFFMHSPSARV